MTFDQITFTNFGLYKGQQELVLGCRPDRPIVLLGGLNGGGKTTLLDGIQLALYGKAARCSRRGNLAYDEFLKRLVHRGVSLEEGAAISLTFRSVIEGNEHVYTVTRSWHQDEKEFKEKVEVYKNGGFDVLLSESWSEHVEIFVPHGVANLFFFDGEKIEDLADATNAAKVLSTAIHSLLGIDLLDKLSADLQIIERRKKLAIKTPEARRPIDELQQEINHSQELHDAAFSERASLQNDLERCKRNLSQTEERYRLAGGDLIKERIALTNERSGEESRNLAIDGELREMIAEATPFLVVGKLLQSLQERDAKEQEAQNDEAISKFLLERDRFLLQDLSKIKAERSFISAVKSWCEADRAERAGKKIPSYINLSEDARQNLTSLTQTILPQAESKLRQLIEKSEESSERLVKLDGKIASIPSEDALTKISDQLKTLQHQFVGLNAKSETLDSQLNQLKNELERKQSRIKSLLEDDLENLFEQKDNRQILKHSEKVRVTLQKYREAVVLRHISKIETLILESFKYLLRKQSLITDIKIDPATFAVTLRGPDGKEVPGEQLSAGERQLLATSMLWGLARASGRPLPTIIDTPLGRLDVSHRDHLVERYFPFASHQVILLSTDAEIDKAYYEKLKPQIHRSYRLLYKESTLSTTIEAGYFWS
jgi:DNA sulfur modification protein DndD